MQNKKPLKKGTKPVKQKQQNQRDLFRLRYFRFKSTDIERTVDFYKLLGMQVLYDEVQERMLPQPPPPTQQKPPKRKEKVVDPMSLLTPEEQQELKRTSRVICMTFGDTTGEVKENRVHLLFEEEVIEQREPEIAVAAEAPQPEEEDRTHQYEYLVIYVHFLNRLIKRITTKNVKTILEPTEFDGGTKMAILQDPNGIYVRLMELDDDLLAETNKQKQWFTRLGYYAMETENADESVTWYDTLFQVRQPKPSKDKKEDSVPTTPKTPTENMQQLPLRKQGAVLTVKQAISKQVGFRLVDMDTFLIGLLETVFYWMGNDMRSNSSCLCFNEVGMADAKLPLTKHKESSNLISIGFEVPSLESVINKLKNETKDDLIWDKFRLKMTHAGVIARFKDKINGIWLDLLCTKTNADAPPAQVQQKPKQEESVKIATDYVVNLHHLKGHARTLSEGAIKLVNGYGGYLLEHGSPVKSKTEDRPIEDDDYSAEVRPKKTLQVMKDLKLIEQFLKRKKSGSCIF
ncbi:hypothetical protein EDD86DRAFT_55286 [Gorgonomyces haynaldii]|nr:hypothetical protein EDD86DRAFT_55286 [Gorgonomyces haynaldii]